MSQGGEIDVTIQVTLLGLDSFSRLNQAMATTGRGANALGSSLRGQVNHWERLRQALTGLEQKYDGVFRAGFRLTAAGRQLTDVGQGILGFLDKAVDKWEDYQFMLNRAAGALSLFDQQSDIYRKLSDGIQEVARRVRVFPAEEVAKAMYFWASTTGQTVKSQKDLNLLMKQITPILKTAALTETSYEKAVKGAYNVTRQFHLGLDKAGAVTKKLLLITQRTSAEFNDLTDSLKYVGPTAGALGVPFNQVIKWLGLIADQGIRGSQAGRALRQMFIQTLRPSAKAKDAYNDVFEATLHVQNGFDKLIFPDGKYIGLTKHVQLLARATKDMTEHQRNQFLATITTANELPVLTAMVEAETRAQRKGSHALDEAKYSLKDYGDAFKHMFDLLKHSWKGALGLWQNTIDPIMRKIGQAFATALIPWIEGLSKVVRGFDKWMSKNPQLVDFAVKVATATGVLLVMAGSVLTVLGSLILFGAGIAFTIEAISAMLGIFGVFIAGWGLIIGVVTAVAVAVVRYWDAIRQNVRATLSNLSVAAKNLGIAFHGTGDILTDIIGPAFDHFAKFVLLATYRIRQFSEWLAEVSKHDDVRNVVRSIVDVLQRLIGFALGIRALSFAFNGLLGSVLIFGGATAVFGKFLLGLTGIPRAIALVRSLAAAFMLLAAHPLVAGLIVLGAAVAALAVAWENDFGGIQETVGGFLDSMQGVIDFLSGMVSKVGPVLEGIARPFVDIFQKNLPKIIDYFGHLWEDVSRDIISSVQQIWASVSSVFRDIADTITDVVVPALQEHLGPIWDSIAKIVTFAMGTIGGVVSFVLRQVVADFTFFAHVIVPALEVAIHGLLAVFDYVFPIILGLVDGVLRIIAGTIDFVIGILTLDWGRAWQGAVEVVQGFVTSLTGALPGPLQALGVLIAAVALIMVGQFAVAMGTIAVNAILDFMYYILILNVRLKAFVYRTIFGQVVPALSRAILMFRTWATTMLTETIPAIFAAIAAGIKWVISTNVQMIPMLGRVIAQLIAMGAAWFVALGPVGWAIGVIGALSAAWITDFLGIRTAIEGVNDATQKWLDTVPGIKNIREALSGLKGSQADLDLLKQSFQDTGAVMQDVGPRMAQDATDLGISMEDMTARVASGMRNTGKTWEEVLVGIEASIQAHKEPIATAAGEIPAGVTDSMANLPPDVRALMDKSWDGVVKSTTQAGGPLRSATRGTMSGVTKIIKGADSAALENVQTTYEQMYSTFKTTGSDIKGIMKDFDSALKHPGKTTKETVDSIIKDLKKMAPSLDSENVKLRGVAQDGSTKLLKILKDLDEDAYNKYIKLAKGLPQAFNNERDRVKRQAENYTDAAKNKIGGLREYADNNFHKIGEKFPNVLDNKAAGVTRATRNYLSGAKDEFRQFNGWVGDWGKNAAITYANAWNKQGGYLYRMIAQYLSSGRGLLETASPPKEGPFHKIDKWAEGAAKVYADSWASQGGYLKGQISGTLDMARHEINKGGAALTSSFSTESNFKKEMTLKVDVTSSDGSVNADNQERMRKVIEGADLITALEHMVTVG